MYSLARAGITGESDTAPEVEARVAELRKLTPLPIACGFGIGSPSQVEAVTKHADAAIVGSALVRRLQNASDPTAAASEFVQELSTGWPSRQADRKLCINNTILPDRRPK